MKRQVYLDYNATTPIKPSVLEFLQEVLAEGGNASSIHGFGRAARRRIETAREQVAALAGTHPNQVVFGSGATEANNTVLHAFAGKNIWVSAVEHSSIVQTVPGAVRIPVTQDGLIDMTAFEKMLSAGPAPDLISIMMVNNETGAIQPVAQAAKLAKQKHPGVFIHTDAVQAAGRIKIDFPGLYADYMTLSSHKMGGPQGVGTLISAPGAPAARLITGGGQEKRLRAGTENVAGIAAFGHAAAHAIADMETYRRLGAWRDALEQKLAAVTPGLVVFSKDAPRVANTCAIGLRGIDANTIIMGLDLDGIAVSSGSACASGAVKTSHVLQAIFPQAHDMAAFRISMGWATDEADLEHFINVWTKIMNRVKPELQKAAGA